MNTSEKIGAVLGGLIIIPLAALILALPTQLLWNYCLTPAVDGIHLIGFWQALGLNFLFTILFKNTNKSGKNA